MKIHETLRPAAVWLGGRIHVEVRGGVNAGLRWTSYPFSAYWRGTADERDTVSAIQNYVRAGSVCWDLGAHFGFYAVMMSRQSGEDGRVYAFEPEPLSFARLRQHIALNSLEGRCIALKLAASVSDGKGVMYAGGGQGGATTHFRYVDEPAFSERDGLRVKTARLDLLVQRGEIQAPDFIKVDVEGHAGAALEGARETIAGARPVVLLSTHGPDESRDISDFFSGLGYTARWSISGRVWKPEDARAAEGVIMLP